ncbi:phosphoribosyl-ATP diphosphatase [Suttonella ornithocola]|uniref:Phosphoribosyl-ATP pyrophosphatase n=1 Tax=Suttonella ornithocola TaxID=279832 RepID=A0A380MX95_9GAMM|nr:phosphoribosyl-ATP diphosphatase [Suttonella ornithocola]SUO97220.1 Phosphoribosyl-ATP pyrophosphatase [Suttonella ornithocola]
MDKNVFAVLEEMIANRKTAETNISYTAQLLQGNIDKLLKKIGEEATEVVIASKGAEKSEVIYESCDLIYHLMVLWAREGITLNDISIELSRRFGQSGLEEKANR